MTAHLAELGMGSESRYVILFSSVFGVRWEKEVFTSSRAFPSHLSRFSVGACFTLAQETRSKQKNCFVSTFICMRLIQIIHNIQDR